MLHPVGSQSPSVYWRRRLLLFGSFVLVVVLIVLTLRAVLSGGNGDHPAVAAPHSGASTASATASTPSPSSTVPPTCSPEQLTIAAAVGKKHYAVGAEPKVMLQVTNTGPGPCVQDLADRQVVLEIYNGVSRVWGSHDCHIESGSHKRTLAVDKPVRVSVIWSGLSSRPHCAGTRQRVGPGTYTLYASLSGHRGTAAQFSLT